MSLYGILAVFGEPEALVEAAGGMRDRGYRHMDAFSPFPIKELDQILEIRGSRLPWIVLAGGIASAALAYALILYSVEIDYPINVGGRPLHSWPPFLVIAFEAGILGAAFAAFFGMLAANGLPCYHHPVFNAEGFGYARGGKFHLLVETADPKYRKGVTKGQLRRLGAESVEEIEA
ncbi:Transmembrane prediction [Mesorhizobium sp. ORS 3324]|nr:Transmembrane prediction [Mesorhizobium sp. ORS 3324]